jgi:hypothetical protein
MSKRWLKRQMLHDLIPSRESTWPTSARLTFNGSTSPMHSPLASHQVRNSLKADKGMERLNGILARAPSSEICPS